MDIIANERHRVAGRRSSSRAALGVLLTLALTGCDSLPRGPAAGNSLASRAEAGNAQTRTIPHAARSTQHAPGSTSAPSVDAKGAQELVTSSKQPESAPSTAQPAIQQKPFLQTATPRNELNSSPSTASNRIEKPAAFHMCSTSVASGTTAPASKPAGSPTAVERIRDPDSSPPVADLIVKGAPHREPARNSKRLMLWIGFGLAGSVVACLLTFAWVRRGQLPAVPEGKKLDPMRANGLLTKEPLSNL